MCELGKELAGTVANVKIKAANDSRDGHMQKHIPMKALVFLSFLISSASDGLACVPSAIRKHVLTVECRCAVSLY